MSVLGKRVEPDGEHFLGPPGTYWKHARTGEWFAHTPNEQLANLSRHKVEEHANGTISVSPSIEVGKANPSTGYWHGFLENGIWRDAP